MATLVNKLNREVKVIIPNMREFSTFYSDKEGVLPMFFKRDWVPVKEEHWKPSEEQMDAFHTVLYQPQYISNSDDERLKQAESLYNDLEKLL